MEENKKQIRIEVRQKIASLVDKEQFLVCGNNDYEVVFDFDSDWDGVEAKTAVFVYGDTPVHQPFNGNVCEGVAVENATLCAVGVFAGDIKTTTGASIRCVPSIRDIGGVPNPPAPEVYDKIMALLDEAIQAHTELPKGGKVGQVLKKKSDKDYDTAWEDDTGADLAQELGDSPDKAISQKVTTEELLKKAEIIDVTSLPIENIKTNALYRFVNVNDEETATAIFVIDGKTTINGFDGIAVTILIVESLPEVGENFVDDIANPTRIIGYYQKSDGKVYFYAGEVWQTPEEAFHASVQIIGSVSEINGDGNYLLIQNEGYIGLYMYNADGWRMVDSDFETVEKLPTTPNYNRLYIRLGYNADFWFKYGEQIGENNLFGAVVNIHKVDRLPKVGLDFAIEKPSEMGEPYIDTFNPYCIYDHTSKTAQLWGYTSTGVTWPNNLPAGWHHFEDLLIAIGFESVGLKFPIRTVFSKEEMTEDGTYTLITPAKNKLYFPDQQGWHEILTEPVVRDVRVLPNVITKVDKNSFYRVSKAELVTARNNDSSKIKTPAVIRYVQGLPKVGEISRVGEVPVYIYYNLLDGSFFTYLYDERVSSSPMWSTFTPEIIRNEQEAVNPNNFYLLIPEGSACDIYLPDPDTVLTDTPRMAKIITDYEFDKAVGDIDTALDSIIEIQNSLMGG